MQTITTKVLGESQYRPRRMKAIHTGKVCTAEMSFNEGWDTEENHKAVAHRLMSKLQWRGTMCGGKLDNSRMVWVFCDLDQALWMSTEDICL